MGRIGAAALTLTVGACGGSTTSPSIPTGAPQSSSLTPSSSVSASDVKAAFLEVISDPRFAAKATISGSVALAGIDGEVSGEWTFDGPDAHTSTTIALPGSEQTNESITIGSDGWERVGGGPWLERRKPADPNKSFTRMLAAVGSLEDLGIESRDAVDLHHFRPADGGVVPVGSLGVTTPQVREARATADFYTTDAGTPESFAFHVTWTQAIGGEAADVTMDMLLDFDEIGSPQAIEPPAEDEVWTRYDSSLGYSMAHPPGWTVNHARAQDTFLIDGQPYVYVAPQTLPAGEKLSSFESGLVAYYMGRFGTEPESRDSTSIGGSPAFRLLYHFTNDAGEDVVLADVGTVHAGHGWEVFIMTLAGTTEVDDITVFDDFVSTFSFTK